MADAAYRNEILLQMWFKVYQDFVSHFQHEQPKSGMIGEYPRLP